MNGRLRRKGEDLGEFSWDEIRKRREAGELTGTEYVQIDGAPDWRPLDWVLRNSFPSGLAAPATRSDTLHPAVWVGAALAVIAFSLVALVGGREIQKQIQKEVRFPKRSLADAMVAARKPVVWTTNTLTAREVAKLEKRFLARQWIDGYKERGQRDSAWDVDAIRLIESWVGGGYSTEARTNQPTPTELADKLASNPDIHDPLVLAMASREGSGLDEDIRRMERAVDLFKQSKHKAFPKFCAAVWLATSLRNKPSRVGSLDDLAVEWFQASFLDRSLTPEDQPEAAEILLHGWGYSFFRRNRHALFPIPMNRGGTNLWLKLVLEGECEMIDAWQARGGDLSRFNAARNAFEFQKHMTAARRCLTEAWQLNPKLPIAASRMISVALGDSGITDMRLWFDRAIAAEIDYPRAWSDLRWGFRPRNDGDSVSLLAFGETAVNTARFDTDIPRMFFDAVADAESDQKLPPGHHIYSDNNVWPAMQRMCEGYIAQSAGPGPRGPWREFYSTVAYLAGRYDIARTQLEAVNWKTKGRKTGWGADLTLMPLEVAARTGSFSNEVARAERALDNRWIGDAIDIYTPIQTIGDPDDRTKEFTRRRLAELGLERRLGTGEWVGFLPQDDDDPAWIFSRGKPHHLATGELEVKSGTDGHFLYSTARTGADLEIRGEFDLVRSSDSGFQAGIFVGLPDADAGEWLALCMNKNSSGESTAIFSHGWSQREVEEPITLSRDSNSFVVKLEHGRATATVNGKDIFRDARPPAPLRAGRNQVVAGLGAWSSSNDAIVRYRNVQIRQILRAKAGDMRK